MKLNICCGKRILPGYMNVDFAPNPEGELQPDFVAPAWALPFAADTFDEIMCIHGWEHFYTWQCEYVFHEWQRVAKSGCKLILELPNLIKCAQNLLAIENGSARFKKPEQMSMWGIFGDNTLKNEHMIHKWGWTPRTLKNFLAFYGATDIREERTQFHPAGRDHRDMRIVARMP